MKALIIGGNGQLGHELMRTCPEKIVAHAIDIPEIDITAPQSIDTAFRAYSPEVVINAAAYTDVDGAEAAVDAAHGVNHTGAGNLAKKCRETGKRLIHVSTDFVFDGSAHRPYTPDDAPNPISVYGESKFLGEEAVRRELGDEALIVRTAWLYSGHGNNFVKTMLRLMGERDRLTVVADQVGTPTWARGLARALWEAVGKGLTGCHHWTDAGAASWYDFSVAVQEEGIAAGLLERKIPIVPIPSRAFPTPAKRPFYSILDKARIWDALGVDPVHWRVRLREMLKELKQ